MYHIITSLYYVRVSYNLIIIPRQSFINRLQCCCLSVIRTANRHSSSKHYNRPRVLILLTYNMTMYYVFIYVYAHVRSLHITFFFLDYNRFNTSTQILCNNHTINKKKFPLAIPRNNLTTGI